MSLNNYNVTTPKGETGMGTNSEKYHFWPRKKSEIKIQKKFLSRICTGNLFRPKKCGSILVPGSTFKKYSKNKKVPRTKYEVV